MNVTLSYSRTDPLWVPIVRRCALVTVVAILIYFLSWLFAFLIWRSEASPIRELRASGATVRVERVGWGRLHYFFGRHNSWVFERANMVGLDRNDAEVADHEIVAAGKLAHLETIFAVRQHFTPNRPLPLSRNVRLKSLYLEESNADDIAVQGLPTTGQLSRLNLRQTLVTDRGMGHISAIQSLESLNLKWCNISDNGTRQLSGLTLLNELDLSSTQISDVTVGQILSVTSLKRLDLSYTRVSPSGIEAVAKLRNLQALFLEGLPVTDDVLEKLTLLSALEELDLCNTQVTEKSISTLCGFSKLKRLSIINSPLGSLDGARQVRRLMPTVAVTN